MDAKLLLFIHLCLLKRVLTQHDECDEVTTNSRMPSIIISTPSVYTALQCEDKCFREASCDGFNFKLIEKNDKYAKCELFKAEKSARFSFANGFSSRWLNRTKTREKWLGKSCGKCNERQQCNRDIDKCNPYPCKCKKGYLDDGDGTCSLIGCTEDALLTESEGNITKPTYLKEECANGKVYIGENFVCYYRLKFTAEKNVTFHFNEFDLKGGSPGYCDTAMQYVKFSPDNQPATRRCSNPKSVTVDFIAKNILVEILFKAFYTPCSKLNGFYKVSI